VQISHSGTVAGVLFDEGRGGDAADLLASVHSLGLRCVTIDAGIGAP
jgi:uncharacterized protein involved in propanediol utilization